MSARAWVAAAALALTCAAAPAAAADETIPVAAGQTTIEGSSSGMTRIQLPAETALRTDDVVGGSVFTTSGDGRYVGWVLRPAGAPVPSDGITITGHRFGRCFAPSCTPTSSDSWIGVWGYTLEQAQTKRLVLPAGTYDLYLIADDAPASVTLKFDGLAGATTLQPSIPVSSGVLGTGSSGAGATAFNYGATLPVTGPGGLVIASTHLVGQGPASGDIGSCVYAAPPVGGQFTQCRGAREGWKFFLAEEEARAIDDTIPTMLMVGPSDTWTMGGYFNGTLPQWNTGVQSVAISFVDLPAPSGGTGDGDGTGTGTGPGGSGDGTQSAPAGSVVGRGLTIGADGVQAQSGDGASADRTPCSPSLRARRTRRGVTLRARAAEACRLSLRLVKGRRTLVRRAVALQPGAARTVRLRAPRGAKRLRLLVVSIDAAGNRSRRALRVR